MNNQIEEIFKDLCEAPIGAVKEDFTIGTMKDSHTDLCIRTIAGHLYSKGWRKSTDVAREIFAEIDNALHKMATEYHQAGHPEYFAVCEMVHHKVMRSIEKKYESEKVDDECGVD